jgi:hypothetical protein
VSGRPEEDSRSDVQARTDIPKPARHSGVVVVVSVLLSDTRSQVMPGTENVRRPVAPEK